MMNKNAPVGFDLTNLKKEIAELKVSNTIIRLAINTYQKKQTLQDQIKKLWERNALLHRLIALRVDPQYDSQ